MASDKEEIKLIHIFETDEGMFDLDHELRNVRPEVRDAIINRLLATTEASPKSDGTCPGCGLIDC